MELPNTGSVSALPPMSAGFLPLPHTVESARVRPVRKCVKKLLFIALLRRRSERMWAMTERTLMRCDLLCPTDEDNGSDRLDLLVDCTVVSEVLCGAQWVLIKTTFLRKASDFQQPWLLWVAELLVWIIYYIKFL